MKKLLSILCAAGLLAFGFNDSQAQDTRFGIKGGLSMYSLEESFMEFSETTDSKLGFAAGLYVEKPLSDMFSLQFEALFVQKGGEDEFGSETLSYVDIPVLLKVNIPLDGDITPYVYGGGFAGYLIDAKAEDNGDSYDIDEFLDDFNYGVAFGAGVSFGMFNVDIRYDMGLANILDADDEVAGMFGEEGLEVSTKGFMLTAGITF